MSDFFCKFMLLPALAALSFCLFLLCRKKEMPQRKKLRIQPVRWRVSLE